MLVPWRVQYPAVFFVLPEGSVNLRKFPGGLISHRSSGCGGALFDPWGVTQADDVSREIYGSGSTTYKKVYGCFQK